MGECVCCGRPAVEINARERWGHPYRERVRVCVFCIAWIDVRLAELRLRSLLTDRRPVH